MPTQGPPTRAARRRLQLKIACSCLVTAQYNLAIDAHARCGRAAAAVRLLREMHAPDTLSCAAYHAHRLLHHRLLRHRLTASFTSAAIATATNSTAFTTTVSSSSVAASIATAHATSNTLPAGVHISV